MRIKIAFYWLPDGVHEVVLYKSHFTSKQPGAQMKCEDNGIQTHTQSFACRAGNHDHLQLDYAQTLPTRDGDNDVHMHTYCWFLPRLCADTDLGNQLTQLYLCGGQRTFCDRE